MKTLCLAAAAAASLVGVATAARAADCEPVAVHRVAPSFFPDGLTYRDHMATISYHIGADGRAADVKVADQNGDPAFVRAAANAIRAWRWNVRACAADTSKSYSVRFTYLPTADDNLTAEANPTIPAKRVDVASADLTAGELAPNAAALRREVLAHGRAYGLRDNLPYLELPSGH
jgi:hypothetical protein